MNAAQRLQEDQAALWNGNAGLAWVETQELLDRIFEPFEELLVERVRAKAARDVLDVGCGTGSTTLAMARALGSTGRCTGIDISEPMIALARSRAERSGVRATFVLADAQTHAFEPADYDMITSRFGVMFFADFVAAFRNFRRAVRESGELALIAWRDIAENPFMTTAERAAAPLLPDVAPRQANERGQFGFADDARVRRILAQSGWAEIDTRPIEAACAFPATELLTYITRLGPLGRLLPATDEATRRRVIETVRRAFDPYVHGDEVRFDAACWLIRARATAR